MKRRLILSLLVCGVLLLALAGWAVDGLRWALRAGASGPVPQPSP